MYNNLNDIRLEKEASQSANPIAALLLCEVMSNISEAHWSAGWLMGNEFALWEMMTNYNPQQPPNYGIYPLEKREVDYLNWLKEQCGGWWYWQDSDNPDESGEVFVSLEQWQQIYAKET